MGPTEAVVERLRRECPYNARQGPQDLIRSLRAEVDELARAIEDGADWEIEDELGDVIFVLTSLAAALTAAHGVTLTAADHHAARKMIGRHPYVFADAPDPGSELAMTQWEENKVREAQQRREKRLAVVVTGTIDIGDDAPVPAVLAQASQLLASSLSPYPSDSELAHVVRELPGGVTAIACGIPGTSDIAFAAFAGPESDPATLKAAIHAAYPGNQTIYMHEVTR